jgi:hypothetical protein
MIEFVHTYIIQYARNWALEPQKTGTHTNLSLCEHEDITVLWNKEVQTDRFWETGQI